MYITPPPHLKLIGLKGSSPLQIESGFTGHHVYCLSMSSGTNWMPLQACKRLQVFFPYVSAPETHPRIIKSSCVLSCLILLLVILFWSPLLLFLLSANNGRSFVSQTKGDAGLYSSNCLSQNAN